MTVKRKLAATLLIAAATFAAGAAFTNPAHAQEVATIDVTIEDQLILIGPVARAGAHLGG